MAPIGKGTFIKGRRQDIIITAASDDEDLPLEVRQELVGLSVPTIFSSEQVKGAAPEGSRLAYAEEVAETLEQAGKNDTAKKLRAAARECDPEGEYHFLVFKKGEYRCA
jgi:hypothetical protein